ncbi:MAG: transglutaminase family protein, partial [Deltaproteobacteria bacterium]|nr:transglutaminase family protein [Deltaproteobacteria bacterium]
MRRFAINHVTVYKYKKPVTFGRHRMMLRPRDSHDLRLLAAGLAIEPAPDTIQWFHDVFGNSVAVASFTTKAAVLKIASQLDLEKFVSDLPDCPIEAYAETYPFAYSAEDVPDLHRLIERQYPDEHHEIDLWAKRFVKTGSETNTLAMLTAITQAIKSGFHYAVRHEEGCQSPVETLDCRSGSCRDFALLMMEVVRALGLAARFVSGYVVPSAGN